MTRIVSIGECVVEMTPSEREGDYRMDFTGDTMNTARYLRHLLP
jgi:2-dehydro-3-deoxygluconokinase